MKTINYLIFIVISFCSLVSGCKKGNNTTPTTPVVVVLPDTIPSGWNKIKVDTTGRAISDIFFINNSLGYACIQTGGIFKSINGGTTWTKVSDAAGDNIAVTSDGKAFFVNNSNSVTKTLDGGVTFISQSLVSPSLNDVFFSNNLTGIISSRSQIFVTTDGSINWNLSGTFPYPDNGYTSAFMYDNTHAWVVYENRIVHATGNLNTAIWQTDTVISQAPNMALITVWATSPTTVFTCSYSGFLYKSTNGGASFTFLQKLNFGAVSSFSDLHFIDSNTGYISVGSRLYKTTDAGNTWQMILALGNTGIIEIHFTDASHGWACCGDGTILKLN